MKKLIYLGLTILIILAIVPVTVASSMRKTRRARLMSMSMNSSLINSRIRYLKVHYKVTKKAWVYAKITNRGRTVKVLRRKALKKRGRYGLKWNGKDARGKKLNGLYKLNIYVRKYKTNKTVKYVKIIRVENKKKTNTVNNTVNNNVLFSDYFDDRPNGLIGDSFGHADSLGKWVVTNQYFHAKDGKGYTGDSATFRLVTKKSNFINFKLSADMMVERFIAGEVLPDEYNGMKLFFRWTDQYNLYVASIQKNGTVVLEKKVNNVYSTLGYASIGSFQTNKWYHLSVTADGNNLTVYLNGKKYIQTKDTSWSKGRVGVRTDNVNGYIDNYVVSKL